MPRPRKYFTSEEKIEARRNASLKWNHANIEKKRIADNLYYERNKERINARRREQRALKKLANV